MGAMLQRHRRVIATFGLVLVAALALTGCDLVSAGMGKGRIYSFIPWQRTTAFQFRFNGPDNRLDGYYIDNQNGIHADFDGSLFYFCNTDCNGNDPFDTSSSEFQQLKAAAMPYVNMDHLNLATCIADLGYWHSADNDNTLPSVGVSLIIVCTGTSGMTPAAVAQGNLTNKGQGALVLIGLFKGDRSE